MSFEFIGNWQTELFVVNFWLDGNWLDERETTDDWQTVVRLCKVVIVCKCDNRWGRDNKWTVELVEAA